ncbi:MAG: type II secretion system F family protein [Candidatus Heimdallarchaeaceae archaeon]
MQRIPFVTLSLSKAKKIAKPFYGIGSRLSKLFPGLDANLDNIDFDINAREYSTIAFMFSCFWTGIIFASLFSIYQFMQLPSTFLFITIVMSVTTFFVSFFYISLYPKLMISKRTKEIEKNIIFALRHLQVQVKSGVSLFDAMVSVSKGKYGIVSKEFETCVKKISTGSSETEALEELTIKNPSLHFRRVVWQITNAIKSGVDIGNILDNIVSNLSYEQKVAIRKYGSQLNPLAMMYMMVAVIMPTLGITFLVILSSFTGVAISKMIFLLILMLLTIFQFSFLGIVKNRRPSVEL